MNDYGAEALKLMMSYSVGLSHQLYFCKLLPPYSSTWLFALFTAHSEGMEHNFQETGKLERALKKWLYMNFLKRERFSEAITHTHPKKE